MAADRWPHEPEILAPERSNSSDPSGRHVPAGHISRDGLPVPQRILQLALPDRNSLRISLEGREETLWPELSAAAMVRSAVAWIQVFSLGFFPLGHFHDDGRRNPRLH